MILGYFTDDDRRCICIVILVFVSRRFADYSYNAINPGLTLAQAIFRVFSDLSIIELQQAVYFIAGDIFGALAGVYCQSFVSNLKANLINSQRSKEMIDSTILTEV